MMGLGGIGRRVGQVMVTVALVGSLSGCSAVILGALANGGTDPASLRKATASYFRVSQGSVRISEVRKSPLGTFYTARVSGRIYNCGVTFGAVDCKRPGA